MKYFLQVNGKYYICLANYKGDVVYQQEITEDQYNKQVN
jgi:hypothetical protein